MIAHYLVRTLRFNEARAAAVITSLGFETFLPLQRRWNSRRTAILKRPLFPQYLFTSFDLERDEWGSIGRARYVDRIMRSATGIPVRIPDRQINVIRQAERHGEYDLAQAGAIATKSFEYGTKVRILTGPFAGLIAEVQRAPPRRRVEILFEILGARVQIELEHLEPIGENP